MRWLGIDGGGTKTAFTAYDEDLGALGSVVLPTCHYAQVGFDGLERVLRDGVERVEEAGWLGGPGAEPYGMGVGMCGYGEGDAATRAIDAIVDRIAEGRPRLVVNDVEAAWAAGLGLADGIVLIAGTGSIAYGVNGGLSARCGGWDYELGDEGSGGWMGKELLRAFTREADGRAPVGALHGLVRDELGLVDDFDVIAYAQGHFADRSAISALAPLVARAARAHDREALGILERAAREEARMVAAVARGLFAPPEGRDAPDGGLAALPPRSIPVAYVGGTFKAGPLVIDRLERALPRCCGLREPLHEAELGAVLLLRRDLGR